MNIHRLLARGHRVLYEPKKTGKEKTLALEDWVIEISTATLVVLALIIYIRKKKQI